MIKRSRAGDLGVRAQDRKFGEIPGRDGRAGGIVALRRGKGWQAGPAGQWERRGAGARRREALAGGPAQQAGDARAGLREEGACGLC